MLQVNINEVVKNDLKIKVKESAKDYYIKCPFCNSKKKPLNINTYKNVFRCNRCGESGSAISLHAKLNGISYDVARESLKEEGYSSDLVFNETKETEVSPLDIRDAMYRSLLKQLTLSSKHYYDLMERGLSKEDIERFGYKTVPVVGLTTIGEKCYSDMIGDVFYNDSITAHDVHNTQTPGFYRRNETGEIVLVSKKDGYLIPVKTLEGKISAFQVRHNPLSEEASEAEKDTYAKYTYLNSGFKSTGASVTGCENIHYTGFENGIPKEVYLTEGCLKADVASTLSKKAFIAVMGVNNVSQLPEALHKLHTLGVKKINLCFDMDYQDKEQVKKALKKVQEMILDEGLKCKVCKWPKEFKGIDDYCLYQKRTRS